MVQIHPGRPTRRCAALAGVEQLECSLACHARGRGFKSRHWRQRCNGHRFGLIAQLEEHLAYTQGVGGSNPSETTMPARRRGEARRTVNPFSRVSGFNSFCRHQARVGLNDAKRDVAQLGSARRLGRRGRTFKSCHPDARISARLAQRIEHLLPEQTVPSSTLGVGTFPDQGKHCPYGVSW